VRSLKMAALALAGSSMSFPMLLAFNMPPSATFFNQGLALFGWGGWMLHLVSATPGKSLSSLQGTKWILIALALLIFAALLATLRSPFPWALSLSNAALLAAAALCAALAADTRHVCTQSAVFCTYCIALVLAGLVSSAVGVLQVFAPALADGDWIARTSVEGRAVGNLRQPNHLCSLLLWAIVAVAWLGETRVIRRAVSLAIAALMLYVVVLSGSRSGVVGAAMLALWGLLDVRLTRSTRFALIAAPVAYGVFWFGMSTWAQHSHQAFGGAGRFSTAGDISSSRFGIWTNTLELIRTHPWFGVGFGEFNFAWSLTEFPGRPVAFFDHTHNLPLQFAVELGLPLAALVLALLGWALWRAGRKCLRPIDSNQGASPQRAAFVMVLLILVHSLLEYPLWYSYFLLPTAFVFGLCLGEPTAEGTKTPDGPHPSRWNRILRAGSMALMLGTAYSVYDYFHVVVIFAPPDNAPPLAERIAIGQRSVFFSHHADYAAATTSDDPAVALPAAQRAAHHLLDTRLMMAWANALHTSGDSERAKYIAQRLVEFRNPQSEAYFAPCKDPSLSEEQRPYQCFAPQRKFTFEDFR
jgi:Virulence factor membrane-bound polymerase, C-terminal/O-Antigen ligase/Protein glycosylation ligase